MVDDGQLWLIESIAMTTPTSADRSSSARGRCRLIHALRKGVAEGQASEVVWQREDLLIEMTAEGQVLKTRWQGVAEALIEMPSKDQHLKTIWQLDLVQSLIEALTKRELEKIGQGHAFQTLVVPHAEPQTLQIARKVHSLQALVEMISQGQVAKTLW